ncbi:permease [Chloroflexota bacterium]
MIFLLAVLAATVTWVTGGVSLVTSAIGASGDLVGSIWLYLLLGFILGGMIQKLIPSLVIARWLGHSAGFKGIIIGSYLGVFLPGGPWVVLPIIASLHKAGAAAGPIIALVAGRALLSLQFLLIWHIPFLGAELAFSRYLVCLLLPPVIGVVGKGIYTLLGRFLGDTLPDQPRGDIPGPSDNLGKAGGA